MHDESSLRSLFVQLIQDDARINMVYKMDFSSRSGTLGFIGSNKEPRKAECKILGFETIGRLVREAFEEVYGKSEIVSSTMRLEEFRANDACLILHPYWKIGIFEIAVRKG